MNKTKNTIKLFKGVVVPQGAGSIAQKEAKNLIVQALKQGVYIDSSIISSRTLKEAKEVVETALLMYGMTEEKATSTFFESPEFVENTDEMVLLLHQMLNYCTVYGFGLVDDAYIQNQKVSEKTFTNMPIDKFTFIKAMSEQELVDSCLELAKQGVALDGEDVDLVVQVLSQEEEGNIVTIINEIKNKEVFGLLCRNFNIVPKNTDDFLRFCVGNVVKVLTNSQRVSSLIARSSIGVERYFLRYDKLYGIENLAKDFNRYKKIFLGLKKSKKENISYVNKISKLSKKYHQPIKQPVLANITRDALTIDFNGKKFARAVNEAPIAVVLRAYQAVNSRLLSAGVDEITRVYNVRNGKTFLKYATVNNDVEYFNALTNAKNALLGAIQTRLKENFEGKVFYIPSGLTYPTPTSGKMFLGNVPSGTSIDLGNSDSERFSFGITWGKPYNVDIDLSANFDGDKNVSYYSEKNVKGKGFTVTHSGDMTSLNPQGYATEYVTIKPKKGATIDSNVLLTVNLFAGRGRLDADNTMPAQVFASDTPKELNSSAKMDKQFYDAQNHLFNMPVTVESQRRSQQVGLMRLKTDREGKLHRKFTLITENVYAGINTCALSNIREELVTQAIHLNHEAKLPLNDLIVLCGGTVVHEPQEDAIDFSLVGVSKDKVLDLIK